ncbi:hypothetical protein [Rhizobium sp. GN54]|uniref:hypothetical protein n=1 Tax=Rhizobium sp. GN54 TaxID=2898150 RepID=UPI001E355A76|nr:hypothetical protein [Rhizobium sp. GN54]MCD2184980.1 hypothetical protein [Rhizobium sp. GN54]
MRSIHIDPAPRAYLATLALMRRSAGGRSLAPEHLTIAEVEAWLLDDAVQIPNLITLFEAFVWRMVRLTFRLTGQACTWARSILSCTALPGTGTSRTAFAMR